MSDYLKKELISSWGFQRGEPCFEEFEKDLDEWYVSKIDSLTQQEIDSILPTRLSIPDKHKDYLMSRFLKRLKTLLR
jgi:hypothetical protein